MKKILLSTIILLGLLLHACTSQKPLYTWGDYEIKSYNYLKNSDNASINELIATYEANINKQKGERGVPPPGTYADYGFLLLMLEQTKQGKMMLEKEMELYPESKIFIDRILNMIEE